MKIMPFIVAYVKLQRTERANRVFYSRYSWRNNRACVNC